MSFSDKMEMKRKNELQQTTPFVEDLNLNLLKRKNVNYLAKKSSVCYFIHLITTLLILIDFVGPLTGVRLVGFYCNI